MILFFPGNQTAADQEHARGEERDAEVDRQLGWQVQRPQHRVGELYPANAGRSAGWLSQVYCTWGQGTRG